MLSSVLFEFSFEVVVVTFAVAVVVVVVFVVVAVAAAGTADVESWLEFQCQVFVVVELFHLPGVQWFDLMLGLFVVHLSNSILSVQMMNDYYLNLLHRKANRYDADYDRFCYDHFVHICLCCCDCHVYHVPDDAYHRNALQFFFDHFSHGVSQHLNRDACFFLFHDCLGAPWSLSEIFVIYHHGPRTYAIIKI